MAFRRSLRFETFESRLLLTAVDIPDDLTGQLGQQVEAPLNIDDATGVRAASIRLVYDPQVLDITESDILVGSVWANDPTADLVVNLDQAAGEIEVFVFAAEALTDVDGSLVRFQFTIAQDATVGNSTILDLTEVRLNEGQITLDDPPQAGEDPTDGLITISGDGTLDASISGTVYADTNLNNQPDSGEGLAGVTITLVNTDTDEEVTTTTGAGGTYSFADLTAGSYLIRQEQPAAFLDGGPNEITVELSSGEELTGQDFRELGLRPQFVYNRLLSTLVMPIGSANWNTAIAGIIQDAASAASGTSLAALPEPATLALAPTDPELPDSGTQPTTVNPSDTGASDTPASDSDATDDATPSLPVVATTFLAEGESVITSSEALETQHEVCTIPPPSIPATDKAVPQAAGSEVSVFGPIWPGAFLSSSWASRSTAVFAAEGEPSKADSGTEAVDEVFCEDDFWPIV